MSLTLTLALTLILVLVLALALHNGSLPLVYVTALMTTWGSHDHLVWGSTRWYATTHDGTPLSRHRQQCVTYVSL